MTNEEIKAQIKHELNLLEFQAKIKRDDKRFKIYVFSVLGLIGLELILGLFFIGFVLGKAI